MLPNKRKLNTYLMLLVSLSLPFISTFGYITYHPPKKLQKLHQSNQKVLTISNTDERLLLSENKSQKSLLYQRLLDVKNRGEVLKREIRQKEQKDTESEEYVRKFKATITAYTAGVESTGKYPGDEGYGVTASGRTVKRFVTVACPPQIELGTWIKIKGIGKRRCDDRGSAVKGKHFDLYIKGLEKAMTFGKQTRTVWVYDEE